MARRRCRRRCKRPSRAAGGARATIPEAARRGSSGLGWLGLPYGRSFRRFLALAAGSQRGALARPHDERLPVVRRQRCLGGPPGLRSRLGLGALGFPFGPPPGPRIIAQIPVKTVCWLIEGGILMFAASRQPLALALTPVPARTSNRP